VHIQVPAVHWHEQPVAPAEPAHMHDSPSCIAVHGCDWFVASVHGQLLQSHARSVGGAPNRFTHVHVSTRPVVIAYGHARPVWSIVHSPHVGSRAGQVGAASIGVLGLELQPTTATIASARITRRSYQGPRCSTTNAIVAFVPS
jgi:hypothetical protein